MRAKIILILSLIVQVLSLHSQEFHWATQVTGDNFEFGKKAVFDDLGNTYLIGFTTDDFEYEGLTYNTNGEGDVFFAKLDINKELVWMKTIGGNHQTHIDMATDIHIDAFGDIYLTFTGVGSIYLYDGQVLNGIDSGGAGGAVAVLIKVSADGDYIWHDSGSSGSTFRKITTDTNGNLYLTGAFRSTITLGGEITLTNPSTGTTIDFLVAKYQPDGTILWAKHAGGLPHNTFASGSDIEINPISNELIVLANANGIVFFDGEPMPTHNNSDEGKLLVSYNLDGTQNWIKRVLDLQNNGYGSVISLAISSSGIMGVCGTVYSDGIVGFYNSDGSVITEHQYPSTNQLRLHSITFNEYDKAYLSGRCNSNAILGISPGTAVISNTTGLIVKMDIFQQVEWVSEFVSSFENEVVYSSEKLLYAGRIDDNFIYNSGQNTIFNNLGDAIFGEMIDTTLHAETFLTEIITVHPNPTSGLFTIQTNTPLQQVEIYNMHGIRLNATDKNEIDLSQHSKGMYLVKITTDKGTAVKKILLK